MNLKFNDINNNRNYKIIKNPNTRYTTNIKINFKNNFNINNNNNNSNRNNILFIPCINCSQLIKSSEVGKKL